MNSLIAAVASLVSLSAGYRLYGRFTARLWDVDANRPPPAHTKHDGIDFVPAKHWTILFGYYFASIAGAGPILGPVAACIVWGWAGGLIWIVLGTIFLGAVHDFFALMVSVKQNGRTIANVCEGTLGKQGKIIFSVFLFCALMLVVAVFAAVGGSTMAAEPNMVIPALGVIPTAVLIGILMYRLRIGQIPATLAGVIMLALLVVSTYLLSKNRPTIYTLTPAFVMLITSSAALVLQLSGFVKAKKITLSIIPGLLLMLADYMSYLTYKFFFSYRSRVHQN